MKSGREVESGKGAVSVAGAHRIWPETKKKRNKFIPVET